MDTCILTSSQFSEFMRILNILKETTTDVDIRRGFIRQRTNSRECIFEIDGRELIPVDISISKITQKIDLFNIFQNQDITLDVDEKSGFYSLKDSFSKIKIKSVKKDYLENKYVSDDELSNIFTLEDKELIADINIPKIVTDRIIKIYKTFKLEYIKINFEENICKIHSKTTSKDLNVIFMNDIVTNIKIDGESDVIIIPFIIDHDEDINLKLYDMSTKDQQSILYKFSTKICNTNIVVYNRASLYFKN